MLLFSAAEGLCYRELRAVSVRLGGLDGHDTG